jgi:hypothetical protein
MLVVAICSWPSQSAMMVTSLPAGDLCADRVAELALERGGHLHVGLEFYGGDRTPTNVELITEAWR